RVASVIENEEQNFFSSIDAGLERIDRILDHHQRESRVMVAGAEAADLYTTYGFPPELFETIAAEHNLTFDWEGYRRAMEKHGELSGAGHRMELFQSGPLDALKKALGGSTFLGYDVTSADGQIVGIIAQ